MSFFVRFEKGTTGYGGIQKHPLLSFDGGFTMSEVLNWLDALEAALDCYNWVLEEQFVSPSEIFSGMWSHDCSGNYAFWG